MSDWERFYFERSGVASEMLGAAAYFDANPEQATDERLARVFRQYVERFRAVDEPGVSVAGGTVEHG